MSYQKREVCDSIIVARRHHCYVAPEVWEVDAATVCGVCQKKNATLIWAVLQQIPTEIKTPVPVDIVKAPVVSIATPIGSRMCYDCGLVQVQRHLWDRGIYRCWECRYRKVG